jgi:hypothetical protein
MTTAWDLAGRYATDVLTDEAVRIIQGHDVSTVGPPLFLYLAHLAVHAGNRGKFLEAPQPEIDRFRHVTDPNRKTYAGKVTTVYHKSYHCHCGMGGCYCQRRYVVVYTFTSISLMFCGSTFPTQIPF